MKRILLHCLLGIALLPTTSLAAGGAPAGMPDGKGSYDELVALFDEFHQWRHADFAYDAAAVAARLTQLEKFQRRLADMAVVEWELAQQVDYLAVQSRFDQVDFQLRVSRPWSRDPGFYTDQMLSITFTELPLDGREEVQFLEALATVSELSQQARANLAGVAADYADLAIRNLSNADGVGHGFPYRAPPPRGVIGWYDACHVPHWCIVTSVW